MNGFGDFQTPPELAHAVTRALAARGIRPARVLEPTCGSGSFLEACAATWPAAELLGIEYQRERYGSVLDALCARYATLRVQYANAYETDFAAAAWRAAGPLLVVGNPPWVTSAALGRAGSDVLQPPRSNPKRLRGLAALTGEANFDVAEYMIFKLLRDFRHEPLHLALLVKESVARNIVSAVDRLELGVAAADIVRIDARRWFGVAVDACCLCLTTARDATVAEPVVVRDAFDGPPTGFVSAQLPPQFGSRSLFRQGIKHDAAAVFELRWDGRRWRNGYDEIVEVEPAYQYPLVKAAALHAGVLDAPSALLVTQQRLGEPTDGLRAAAPHFWAYLSRHAPRLAARKSSIYINAPPYAMFGIGSYSFAPWKVAVAGLYAQPRFRVIGPRGGRPVVFGDTSYFASFETEAAARAFGALCAGPTVTAFLAGAVKRGKRPLTKALLDRLNWNALAGAPEHRAQAPAACDEQH